MRKVTDRDIESLYKAILSLDGVKEAKQFFRDLLTEVEILELAERWKVAKLLSKGVSYTEIIERTGLSSTTVARVARWVKRGRGGYSLILKRTKLEK